MMLQDKHFVIIGTGNIGRILVRRLLTAGVHANHLAICDADPDHRERVSREFGVQAVALQDEMPSQADAVLIATPPDNVLEVLRTIAPHLHKGQVVISFASAFPLSHLEELAPAGVCVTRVITNTPSMVGSGINPVAYGHCVSDDTRALVSAIMATLGDSIAVHDEQMNWCYALTAAAMRALLPVVEGMSQAGIDAGLSSSDARRIAAEVLRGTAELVLHTDMSFDELKALTPLQIVDEALVARLFRDAAHAAKDKADQNEHRLFG